MMITGEKNNTHWSRWFATCPDVFVDGVKQVLVLRADDEAGEVERIALNDGLPFLVGAEICRETVSGVVEIRGARREQPLF